MFLIPAVAAAAALTVSGPRMLEPSEIARRLDKLEAKVEILERSKAPVAIAAFAKEMWPSHGDDISFPSVVTREGRRVVVQSDIRPESYALALEAEKPFKAEEWEEAAKLYQKGLEKDPDSYLLLMNLGDCRYEQHRDEEALELYERAIHLNPHDHRLWWFRGQVLLRLARTEAARASLAQALSLRPHYRFLVGWLKEGEPVQKRLGIRLDDSSFEPKVLVVPEGAGAKVYWEPDALHWLVYGMCKALWLADPTRREEALGLERRVFSTFEEQECLVNLLEVYLRKTELPREPALDRLRAIQQDGMLDGFALYELGSRIAPWITLTLTDAEQERIRRYIRKYVLVPVEEKPAGAAPGAPQEPAAPGAPKPTSP